MPLPTKAELDALNAKYAGGKLTVYAADELGVVVVVRRPNRHEVRRYRQVLLNDETRAQAAESLMCCVVWPEPSKEGNPQLEAILDEYPLLEQAISSKVLALAGNEVKLEKKEI